MIAQWQWKYDDSQELASARGTINLAYEQDARASV